MIKYIKFLFLLLIIFVFALYSNAQQTKINGYHFTIEQLIKTTPIKNQQQTSTCWSFATVSFIETELIRMGKGEYDLSEMFIVRNTYLKKAEQYIRMQGYCFFTPGGQAHDAMTTVLKNGLMPETIYNGLTAKTTFHNHNNMDKLLKNVVDTTIHSKSGVIASNWYITINHLLDSCLGKAPETFIYKENKYTPSSFLNKLQFNPNDYIEITSYSHHPYNISFVLEDKFNWASANYYNVCLSDFISIIDSALDKGYSIVWDGDVSEKTYFSNIGIAVIPEKNWENKTIDEKNFSLETPQKELLISENLRQATFDNHTTTVDHLMHIVGKAKDQNGTIYYILKNSWGNSVNDGFVYMSKSYLALKTVAIMLNKKAIFYDVTNF